ncbi:MAG: ABC transporter ATP-binding protein [Azoarcus sp.]|nr:ABC transporter ATP-binding protein [Azoarcus sp.]
MRAGLEHRLHLRLRARAAGRQRWESRHLVGRPVAAARLGMMLSACDGVRSAAANPATGRIFIECEAGHDPDLEPRLRASLLRLLSEEALGEADQPAASASAPSDTPRPGPNPILELMRRMPRDRRGLTAAPLWSAANNAVNFLPELGLVGIVNVVNGKQFGFLKALGAGSMRSQVVTLGALTGAAFAAELLIERKRRRQWRKIARQAEHDIRSATYAHVQELDMGDIEKQSTGEMMNLIWDNTSRVKNFLESGADDILQRAISAVVIVVTLAAASPALALSVLAPLPVIIAGSRYVQRKTEPPYADMQAAEGRLNKLLGNNLSDIATIKSFTSEAREAERMRDMSAEVRDTSSNAVEVSSRYTDLMRLLISVSFAVSMVIGGFLVARKSITPAMFTLVLFFVPKLLVRMEGMGESYDQYRAAMGASRSILDVLERRPRIVSGERPMPREAVRGAIDFRGVGFGYDASHPVLTDFDLEIPARGTVAFVGATGSGKSTIMKLLMRFYDVDAGGVFVDGHDLREFDLASLRRNIGFVSQDVFLFDGSVYDNILYGRPDASFDEVVEAARAAEAHEFILGLPDGYRSQVGERGKRLSGGQRQRISIARAILKDPPILVLDEATSAVDNETEAAIQRSIERISGERTTLLIAHRLSTVRNADCIHVMANGRIVESGRHKSLLAKKGVYAGLWQVQTGQAARGDSRARA